MPIIIIIIFQIIYISHNNTYWIFKFIFIFT